jgi:formate-dependent nitrite reductase membrane component NrfD
MDAMQLHWNEWGFPGKDMLHLHSTPLATGVSIVDLPMLALWLWMMITFWLTIARAERRAADLSDTHSYGILLGTLGALTGFLLSSLVNYNYGDAEAAMMFWFLMGIAVSVKSVDLMLLSRPNDTATTYRSCGVLFQIYRLDIQR